jgi:N-acetylglucosaminyl-diphospho-decaprenol L-rhamnosyltransferase
MNNRGLSHKAVVVDVVIVNWNTGQQLQECLQAVSGSRRDGFTFGRIVVVDNASSDGSATDLKSFGLPLCLIQNPTNRGFAAACNQGAEGSTADYVLFLNPDTRVYPDTVARSVAWMESPDNSRIGIVGVQMVDENGIVLRHCTRFIATRYFMNVMLGLNRLSPARFPGHAYDEWDHLQSRPIEHVIGAYFLVRRSVFTDLGGFDERFFVYYEDVDLSLRASQAGWSVYYLASARCYHACGRSSEQVKARRLFYILQSRIFYAFKNLATWNAIGLLLATLFIEPVARLVRAIAAGSVKEIGELVRGYFLLWLAVPRILFSGYLRRPQPLKLHFEPRPSGVGTQIS